VSLQGLTLKCPDNLLDDLGACTALILLSLSQQPAHSDGRISSKGIAALCASSSLRHLHLATGTYTLPLSASLPLDTWPLMTQLETVVLPDFEEWPARVISARALIIPQQQLPAPSSAASAPAPTGSAMAAASLDAAAGQGPDAVPSATSNGTSDGSAPAPGAADLPALLCKHVRAVASCHSSILELGLPGLYLSSTNAALWELLTQLPALRHLHLGDVDMGSWLVDDVSKPSGQPHITAARSTAAGHHGSSRQHSSGCAAPAGRAQQAAVVHAALWHSPWALARRPAQQHQQPPGAVPGTCCQCTGTSSSRGCSSGSRAACSSSSSSDSAPRGLPAAGRCWLPVPAEHQHQHG
jgi:hypothetical protein